MNTALPFLLCIFLVVQPAFGSDLNGSDDFNDNSKNSAKWGADIALGACSFTETNQQLQLSAAAVGIHENAMQRPWILNTASPSLDWEIIASVNNNSIPGLYNNQSCVIGLAVMSSAALGETVSVGLYASTMGGPPLRRGFVSVLSTNNMISGLSSNFVIIAYADSFDIGVTSGAVRLLFNSRTKVITSYFDAGGHGDGYVWAKLGSFGVGGSNGETGNFNWDLSGSQPFIVGVCGEANNINVAGGPVSVDDFSALTGSTAPPVLQASKVADQLTITWPRAALGFVLQERVNLGSGDWTDTGPAILINDLNLLRTNFSTASKFYRLRSP